MSPFSLLHILRMESKLTDLYSILATSSLAHRVSIDTEIVAFAVLDILTQGIFGYWLLVSHDSSPSM